MVDIEKRKDFRRGLFRNGSAKLMRKVHKEPVKCRLVDVSQNGIGMMTHEELQIGEELILEINREEVEMEVIWFQENILRYEMNRYGLQLSQNMPCTLETLFFKLESSSVSDMVEK